MYNEERILRFIEETLELEGNRAFAKAVFVSTADMEYDLDKDLLKRAYISNARVYCSLKNFITTSKVDGYDSERGGAVTFPLAKQVVVGLNVTF